METPTRICLRSQNKLKHTKTHISYTERPTNVRPKNHKISQVQQTKGQPTELSLAPCRSETCQRVAKPHRLGTRTFFPKMSPTGRRLPKENEKWLWVKNTGYPKNLIGKRKNKPSHLRSPRGWHLFDPKPNEQSKPENIKQIVMKGFLGAGTSDDEPVFLGRN